MAANRIILESGSSALRQPPRPPPAARKRLLSAAARDCGVASVFAEKVPACQGRTCLDRTELLAPAGERVFCFPDIRQF